MWEFLELDRLGVPFCFCIWLLWWRCPCGLSGRVEQFPIAAWTMYWSGLVGMAQ